MILTGSKLTELCRPVFGNDWQQRISYILNIHRASVWRWGKKKTGHTRAVKAKLLTAAEEQLRITAALVDKLRDDLGIM